MKGSGCSFSFSAKEKEPKRKLSGCAFFYERLVLWPGYYYPKKPMPELGAVTDGLSAKLFKKLLSPTADQLRVKSGSTSWALCAGKGIAFCC